MDPDCGAGIELSRKCRKALVCGKDRNPIIDCRRAKVISHLNPEYGRWDNGRGG